MRHALPVPWLAAFTLLACQPRPTVVADPAPAWIDAGRLTEVLELQFQQAAAAWNAGDLDRFLASYAPDTATTFVDGRRPQRGIAWIRAHYAPAFAPGARRDSLRIEELTARPLTVTIALVTARYVLYRNGMSTGSGPFTVVMEEGPDGWKILHDHSSSDPR
ncbi:MAG: SgcJ/EcaC family oxidoreductase [Gemmatimonadales bacterium]|nr:SgcJ/EcaC family oxidoreductase [Gemmatimonadales bacterium]